MKQLLLTIRFKPECEPADFLAASGHSPQWLGDPTQWKIRKMSFHTDGKGKEQMSALLENEDWSIPEVKALTGSEIYEKLKALQRSAKVVFGIRKGCWGSLEQIEYGSISGLLRAHGYNGFLVETRGGSEITLGELLDALHIGEKAASGNEVIDSFNEACREADNGAQEQWLAETPAAVALSDTDMLHPVTEIVVTPGEVTVVYNRDVTINPQDD